MSQKSSLPQPTQSVSRVLTANRLERQVLNTILIKIRDANRIDPARAMAIVNEHSDALKSGHIRDFAIKYTSVV